MDYCLWFEILLFRYFASGFIFCVILKTYKLTADRQIIFPSFSAMPNAVGLVDKLVKKELKIIIIIIIEA